MQRPSRRLGFRFRWGWIFALVLTAPGPRRLSAAEAGAVPAVRIEVDLQGVPAGRERAYGAVWITGPDDRVVRTLAVWGSEPKHWKELRRWWSSTSPAGREVDGISGASRRAGRYEVLWDGRDMRGQPVAPGRYVVQVEVAREKGPRTLLAVPIDLPLPPSFSSEATPATPGDLRKVTVYAPGMD